MHAVLALIFFWSCKIHSTKEFVILAQFIPFTKQTISFLFRRRIPKHFLNRSAEPIKIHRNIPTYKKSNEIYQYDQALT